MIDYAGYWPAQSAVVVAHQGTDPLKMFVLPPALNPRRRCSPTRRMSDLTDLNLEPMAPDSTLFPNLPSDVQVHSGFAIEHKKTASLILAEVKDLMEKHSSTHVILVRRHTAIIRLSP